MLQIEMLVFVIMDLFEVNHQSQTSLLQLMRIFGFNWQIAFLLKYGIIKRLEKESVIQ